MGKTPLDKKKTILASIFCWVLFSAPGVQAGWETGARISFDSNIDRAVENADRQSDIFFTPYLSWFRLPSGESRVDWTLGTTLEGALFADLKGLNSLSLTAAPGLNWIPHRIWTINVSPFFQAKGVSDSEQSALAFGAKITMRQVLGKDFYLGEYYLYRDSRAEEDVYSYVENTLGIYAGRSWTRNFFTEIGYDYSYGDSFRSLPPLSGPPSFPSQGGRGRGEQMRRRYSSAFDREMIKEKVGRHSFGLSAGIDWTKSLFSTVAYQYAVMDGDSGTSSSHYVSLALLYRF